VVSVPTTNVEGLIRLVIVQVQAAQAPSLAAGGWTHSTWKMVVGKETTLLVANTKMKLLVYQARSWLVRARAIPSDIISATEQGGSN